jgi:hypothetical protein
VKKSEIFKHLIKVDKVKLNWLTTACMVSFEDLEEIANEYGLEIDDHDNIHAPKKDSIIKEMKNHIKKTEEAENKSLVLQPSFLETEFSSEIIANIESIFRNEGFDFRSKKSNVIVTESGISIKSWKELQFHVHWYEIKNIRITRQREDKFIFGGEEAIPTTGASEPAIDIFNLMDITLQRNRTFQKMGSTFHNFIIISMENGNYKQINTSNFRLKQKIPIQSDYDLMVIILEHIFYMIRRKQLDLI